MNRRPGADRAAAELIANLWEDEAEEKKKKGTKRRRVPKRPRADAPPSARSRDASLRASQAKKKAKRDSEKPPRRRPRPFRARRRAEGHVLDDKAADDDEPPR